MTEAIQEMWRESERKDRERKRRRHAAEWYGFYSHLADSHARISQEFERRAEALLEEPGRAHDEYGEARKRAGAADAGAVPGAPRGAAARRERIKDLLDRYASAKRSGAVTEELGGAVRAVHEAMGRPKPGGRGEG